jgi:hypothetical protein
MNNPIHFADVEELAMRRFFDELTPDEKTQVLVLLGSAEAYDNLRATLLKTREELALESVRLEPRTGTRTALLHAMQARQKSTAVTIPTRLTKILTYKLPAYQLAAAVVVAIAAVLLLNRADVQTSSQMPQVVYIEAKQPVAQIDREELIQRVVDSLKEDLSREFHAGAATVRRTGNRFVHRDTAQDVYPASDTRIATQEARPNNVFIGLGNLPQLGVQKKGRTLAEDSSLSKFMTTVRDERM